MSIALLGTVLVMGHNGKDWPVPFPPARVAHIPVAPGTPEDARPVRAFAWATIPEDPVLGCVHRTAATPYDFERVDQAARRILQEIAFTRLHEASSIPSLRPLNAPPDFEARLWRQLSPEERRQRRERADLINRQWEIFKARVYELRMFAHRPEEAKRAAHRATLAWDKLLGWIEAASEPLPKDLQDELARVDAWVGVLRSVS